MGDLFASADRRAVGKGIAGLGEPYNGD